ncbi:MAG: hypothetical protein JWN85_2019 [Gammaproteobacteria bacterium]|nr:hypothetical protein [Gammaproteobacteria bacterium]
MRAHPGKGKSLQEELLDPPGLSAHALAKGPGVPLPRANHIIRQKRAISPVMGVLPAAVQIAVSQPSATACSLALGRWLNDAETAGRRVVPGTAPVLGYFFSSRASFDPTVDGKLTS